MVTTIVNRGPHLIHWWRIVETIAQRIKDVWLLYNSSDGDSNSLRSPDFSIVSLLLFYKGGCRASLDMSINYYLLFFLSVTLNLFFFAFCFSLNLLKTGIVSYDFILLLLQFLFWYRESIVWKTTRGSVPLFCIDAFIVLPLLVDSKVLKAQKSSLPERAIYQQGQWNIATCSQVFKNRCKSSKYILAIVIFSARS